MLTRLEAVLCMHPYHTPTVTYAVIPSCCLWHDANCYSWHDALSQDVGHEAGKAADNVKARSYCLMLHLPVQ